MYKREQTKKIKVGNLYIGGENSVIIQSMTNTRTKNVEATVEQIKSLVEAGCQIVRLAVLNMEDAEALKQIRSLVDIPLVADIHFDYRLALKAVEAGFDKIRINPGNIGDEEKIKLVVDACNLKNIPIRIGINSGSLEKHILEKYHKPTPEAMVASAKYHVELLEKFNFTNIIISLKSSSVQDTIKANLLAAEVFPYPLHLGVTESGTTFGGTIASSIGLGTMLYHGIGSTIRVSLTADPVEEIKVAKEILANFKLYKKPKLISCPTCGRIQYDMIPVVTEIEKFLESINKDITIAIMGCVVNGPGEAKEANIAVAGGLNEALLFIDGVKVRKVSQHDLIETLKEIIKAY
ncbi:MAG: flavodoxin-dependent (E)-4-hydroxy-3-methylbut-2-enyl-diphosphate synthase [Candidatus Izemoplasmatales bacterium]|nr:flavodoxin-dependent (E)-4-hydroxy-3-methylbut-2-enyl-diphosphate synthase [Candidatus Izemoplasmatales bacterium]